MKLQRARATVSKYPVAPEKIALILALLFGLISAMLVPQMTPNDEGAHFLKSYSLSSGKFAGRLCTFPDDIIDKANSVSADALSNDYSTPIDYSESTQTSCGSAAGYSLIMHVPQAIGFSIGKAFNQSPSALVLLGRFASAIFYATALYFIIKFVKHNKWTYFVVGLLPLMIHTAGSLSGDTVNNVIIMATLAYIFNLISQKELLSKKQMLILAGLSFLLTLTKVTNVIFLLTLVALPTRLFQQNSLSKVPFNIHKWGTLVIYGLVTIVVAFFAQILFGSSLFHDIPVENPLLTNPSRFFVILYNTYISPTLGYNDLLLRGIIGEFASFKYHLPSFVVFLEFVALGVALFYKQPGDTTIQKKDLSRLAVWCAVSFTLFITVITFALYSAWAILPNRLGPGALYADGVQGRYFTAALVGLIPIAMWLRQYLWVDSTSKKNVTRFIVSVSVFGLLFYTAQTYITFT